MSKIMGQRIHDKREEYRLTQEELAFKLGVSKQTISKWEKGLVKNIDRDYIARMAGIFHCDVDWLMHMDGSPKVTVTYEAPERETVTAVVNQKPIMGPAALRAQLYEAAMMVSPENLNTAIKLLMSLSPIKNVQLDAPPDESDSTKE